MSIYNLKLLLKGVLVLIIMILFSDRIIATTLPSADNKSFDKAVESLIRGNYDEALRLFEKAYTQESLYPNSVMMARILGNIGIANYQLGLYDKAISYYLKTEDIYNRIGDEVLDGLAKVHVNLAICYLRNGDMGNALSHYESSERIFHKLNMTNTPEYESLLNNFAAFYMVNSDYKKALEYNEKAFNISSKNSKEYIKWISKGYIYYKIRDFNNSLDCYNTALRVIKRDQNISSSGIEQIYNNLGLLYLDSNEFGKALENFEKARTHILQTSGKNNATYSLCLNRIGMVYLNMTENASDLDLFLEHKKENILQALKYYQESLHSISPEYTNYDLSDNPPVENIMDKTQLLVSLKNKAEALGELSELEEKSGNRKLSVKYLKDAVNAYQISAKVIHLIRTGFINEDSRLLLAENEQSVYLGAIEAAVNLFQHTNERKHFELAFEFSERSRSTDFLTMVRNTRAKTFAGMPDSLLQKETELKSEIAAYKDFVFNESSKPGRDLQKIDLWKAKIFNLGQSYEKLIHLFESEYPKYYDFKYADPIVSLEEVQSRLRPREALIEYVVNEPKEGKDGEIFSFLITKQKFKVHKQEIDSSFVNSINIFLKFLKDGTIFNTRKKEYIEYSTNAYRLYNWLIAPFSNEVKGYHLVIVPDGKLSYLPFDAFLTNAPDTKKMDFRGLNYLVYDHAISYSYSATLLYYYFNSKKRADKELAAFVPKYDENLVNVVQTRPQEQFLPLPGAKLEVGGITKLLKGKVYMDGDATISNFRSQASKYDILHLAMHTIINDSLPMYSKLVFTPDHERHNSIDTYEIYNMEFMSRLTVLSACNTGSGRLQKGEGVMSLARAFLYAGCPSIVMTLWSVEDESSANMMIGFYKNLLNGYSKDEALRKAKIKHIQSADPLKAHPYYWLGYVSIGDQVPLYDSKIIYFVGMIIFIILAILGEKIYVHIKMRNKMKIQ